MIAKLQKARTAAANEPLVSKTFSSEAPMIAEHADSAVLQQHEPSDRRLRNRIILANALVWIAIIVLIRLLFF